MAIRIDGNALAAKLKAQITEESGRLERKPGLAVILVGEDPASRIYVTHKEKDCADCGFFSVECKLPAETSEAALLEKIRQFNADPAVDGILVQMPLPKHFCEETVINAIAPEKDVDAFHPFNVGRLVIGEPMFLPCTPAGVMEILKEYNISVRGKRCVVVGRSNIVGKPMAQLLLQQDGTVTMCHSRTEHLEEYTRQADILVSAVGRVGLITGDMVKEGAVVIDVAMNRGADGKLCGDVVFAEAEKKAAFITPVPGGVGPMTRAVLMKNILTAAQRRQREEHGEQEALL